MNAAVPTSTTYELASVLFMDIVGYSLRSIDDQAEALTALEGIVRASTQYQHAESRNELIPLPTGDGMALVFLRDPVSPVKCALEIAAALKSHPEIGLRMGVHQGPVCRHADIKKEVNVIGGGINIAQRVMDCGDAGHILLSRNVAEMLEQLRGWSGSLRDLGIQEVKHGVEVHLYNLCKDGLGNTALPKKLAARPPAAPSPKVPLPPPAPPANRARRLLVLGIAAVASVAAVGYFFSRPGPIPAKTVPITRTLQYSITMQRYRDGKPYRNPEPVAGKRIFESDYRIRLNLSSSQPGYLYILNEGPKSSPETPDLNTLFPAPNEDTSHLDANQQINIPHKDYIVFDGQKGTEKLWLIWAAAPVQQFEDLKKWASAPNFGAIRDEAQARGVWAALMRYAQKGIDPREDDKNGVTSLTCQCDVLVYRLALDHD